MVDMKHRLYELSGFSEVDGCSEVSGNNVQKKSMSQTESIEGI